MPNTALSCNHQSTRMPQLQSLFSDALIPMYYPEQMKLSPVQLIKLRRILAPTRESNQTPGPQSRVEWQSSATINNRCTQCSAICRMRNNYSTIDQIRHTSSLLISTFRIGPHPTLVMNVGNFLYISHSKCFVFCLGGPAAQCRNIFDVQYYSKHSVSIWRIWVTDSECRYWMPISI